MAYRIRVTRPPTDRFGSTTWDLLDSHGKPLEFATAQAPEIAAGVRVGVEQARYSPERLRFETYWRGD